MVSWWKKIVSNVEVLGGRPTFQGTRVSVEFVMSLRASGWGDVEVLEAFPSLDEEDIIALNQWAHEMFRSLPFDTLESVSDPLEDTGSLVEDTDSSPLIEGLAELSDATQVVREEDIDLAFRFRGRGSNDPAVADDSGRNTDEQSGEQD